MNIWLASRSPRRKQILTALGFSVSVHPSDADETRLPGEDPVAYALRTAIAKAADAPETALVLAADTVVHLGSDILHKPTDLAQAASHLRTLSGVTHAVTTGVCIRVGSNRHAITVTTEVRFRDLHEAEITAYVQTGEANDKAGAYGIQGLGGMLVAEVRGSWTNVMGLPAEAIIEPLERLGGSRWTP